MLSRFTLHALSLYPSWCSWGASSARLRKTLMTVLYMWLRHISRSAQWLSGSHSLGVRSRHVSKMSFRSPNWWAGFWLPMSASTLLLSCSSTTCCMLRSSGILAHRFISGSCHHVASRRRVADWAYFSASATWLSMMSRYAVTMCVVTLGSEFMARGMTSTRRVSQSGGMLRHKASVCSRTSSAPRAYSVTTSHWHSSLAVSR
mmetsp:Transcript_12124/g.36402  ORF Transcript_12124/g.36402 Transcript_12124/m.36402 type:complete len:203 (-) Transcript_12124:3048-3656(-)